MTHRCLHHGCRMIPSGVGRGIICPVCAGGRPAGRPLTYKRRVPDAA